MAKIGYTGVIPPVLTCFDKKGEFWEKGQRELIRFLLPNVNGFYPTGTYGSGPLMEPAERKRVLEVILEEVNGVVPVIAHVGAATTEQTVDLAKHAQVAGADGVGAIPPYYYIYPQADLLNYFRAIIDAVEIDVFAYNNPRLSNNPLDPGMIETLSKEGLAGLKDSSFDMITFYQYIDRIKDPEFVHIVGTEAIAAPAIQAGAKAMISGLANVWPEIVQKLWKSIQNGDPEDAAKWQIRINEARAVLKLAPTLVVCYTVLSLRGIDAGGPRLPFSPLDSELAEKVKTEFIKLGLFN
jgi:dihydrodipicolinate synthase/N-acetylneuraminate lyase